MQLRFIYQEQVNEWTKKIRKEGYNIDRQINGIKREEMKVSFMLYNVFLTQEFLEYNFKISPPKKKNFPW